MIKHTLSAKQALLYALGRAGTVIWGGFVAVGMYWLFVSAGPAFEGQFAPVVTRYSMMEVQKLGQGFSFVPRFHKDRDCVNQGSSWYAPNEYGDLVRLTPRRITGEPQSPQTGPTGWRIGERQALYPPEGATYVMGVFNHDCRWIWQTRTSIGQIQLEPTGLPILSLDDRTGQMIAVPGPPPEPATP